MKIKAELMKLIPSALSHERNSNTAKVAELLARGLEKAKSTYTTIADWYSVDAARGKALDRLGAKYGVVRGPCDDSFYRYMIKAKQATRQGDSSVDGILRAMQNALGIDVAGVVVEPATVGGSIEPQSLRIMHVPLRFARSEYEQRFMLSQIEGSVALGVKLRGLQFDVALTGTSFAGAGMASVAIYHLDNSADHTVDVDGRWGVGGTQGYVSVTAVDDSVDYSHALAATAAPGASVAATDMTTTDDSVSYTDNAMGSAGAAMYQSYAAEVVITDQWDARFDIGTPAYAGAVLDYREEVRK